MDNDASGPPFPNGMDEISKRVNHAEVPFRISGPLSLRKALQLSQAQLGQLLGHYTVRKGYTKYALSVWERVERGVRLPGRYAMTERTRKAYGALLADVVSLASEGRYRLKADLGPRAWHFKVYADCAHCGRPFQVERWGWKRCRRCRR